MLSKKHGPNSEFAELYQKNQEAIKVGKQKQHKLLIVLIIAGLFLLLSGFIKGGIVLASIIIIGIIAYTRHVDMEYQKSLNEIFNKNFPNPS
jgi:hypothetical protein